MRNNQNKIPDFNRIGRQIIGDITRYALVSALNFFKGSFDKQGFTDAAFTPWPKRNPDMRQGAAILTQSGNLRDSLKVLERTPSRLIFGSHTPYSQIQNEGGTITIRVTDKSRRFFWRQYMRYEKHKKANADVWRWMALTGKEQFTINIPKRQFIGHSQTLMTTLNTWAVRHIETEFKKHINL